jgi:signal peptidase II
MIRRAISLGLAAFVLASDQASKLWAIHALSPMGRHVVQVVPGCFELGILGFLPLELRRNLLTGFAIIAIVVLLGLIVMGRIQRNWTAVATGLILGGAIGNVIDRVRLGFVVDFIDWHIGDRYHWPTFNIADSGIVVGVFVLLWISYWLDRKVEEEKPEPSPVAK